MGGVTSAEARARAIAVAGADDFGPPGFEAGLDRLLAAIAVMPLTDTARREQENKVVGDLVQRLRIERWLRDNPDAASRPIEAPVIVCGLPRTGTTATVAMLALDDRLRFLRAWEALDPVPPPVAGEEDADPRALAARAAARSYDKPEMHLHDPDGPEEDMQLLASYDMHPFAASLPMPRDYLDWWVAEDFASTYAYTARVLSLLHAHRPPRRWLLKSPSHIFHLEALARQFPDARFVMTHRDPAKVIPSVASLIATFLAKRMPSGTRDDARLGGDQLDMWRRGMERALAARAAIGEERFIDVYNDDVIRRPLETFERIYSHIGLDLGPELRARLAEYGSRNAPGSRGAHSYTLEQYGLSTAAVHDAFRDYYARFFPAVAVEA